MASNYCTIIEKMDDYDVYVYKARKKHLKKWLKEGRFNDYIVLHQEDLAEECNMSFHKAPCVIILDNYKHIPVKKSEQTLIKYEL